MDAQALQRGVSVAIGLQQANARRAAELAAAEAELQAAQRRIVLAADRARTRLQRRLEREAISRAERLRDRLAQSPFTDGAAASLSTAIDELNALADGLHPTTLRDGGLAGALERLAQSARLDVHVNVPASRYPDEIELVVYFVCAEALANAIKHSAANRVNISVDEESSALVASVSDDGIGGAEPNGSGIAGLAARANAVGGRIRVTSPAGGGTIVRLSVPL